MATYEKDNGAIGLLADEIIGQFRGELRDAGLKIDILKAYASRNENGDPTGPAIKLHGQACHAIVRIIGLKDRAKGHGDAEITVDGDEWNLFGEMGQRAILHHEIEHLVLVTDAKSGAVKRDDLDRPKLRMRLHDHQFGWFDNVARIYRENAIEVQQASSFLRDVTRVQLYLPGFNVKEAIDVESRPVEDGQAAAGYQSQESFKREVTKFLDDAGILHKGSKSKRSEPKAAVPSDWQKIVVDAIAELYDFDDKTTPAKFRTTVENSGGTDNDTNSAWRCDAVGIVVERCRGVEMPVTRRLITYVEACELLKANAGGEKAAEGDLTPTEIFERVLIDLAKRHGWIEPPNVADLKAELTGGLGTDEYSVIFMKKDGIRIDQFRKQACEASFSWGEAAKAYKRLYDADAIALANGGASNEDLAIVMLEVVKKLKITEPLTADELCVRVTGKSANNKAVAWYGEADGIAVSRIGAREADAKISWATGANLLEAAIDAVGAAA